MTGSACQHHSEEAAVGICVRCGAPLCDACITKLDGINHCRSCLLLRAAQPEAESVPVPSALRVNGWLALAMGLALLGGLALTMLNAVLPAGAP